MFERYTEAARQVVVLAQEEARTLGHRHIGAEHLLLGVVRVEPAILPARAQDIRARIGRGPGETPAYTPFTEGAQAALGRAPGEADALGQGAVRPGHILLALAQEPEAVLASGAHADRIRIDALRRLASGPQDFDLDATIVAGGAVPVWLGAPDLPIGDLGHPRVDGRLLLAMLAKDGRSAALLREHGLDEGTVRARLGP